MIKNDRKYMIDLVNLHNNTTYYIRYSASNRYSSSTTQEISEAKTLQPSVPTITLKSISDIWDTHAKVQIALNFDGGAPILEMGVCWDRQTTPVIEKNKLTTKDTIATLDITDLQPNTRYIVRAYAINKIGITYSEEYEFTTYVFPEVKTEEITEIQLTTALLKGTLVFNGNDTATIKGFCWGTNAEPTVENEHIEIDTISAAYTYRLANLIDETQYYVRAYAQNKIGLVYGETKSFTTQSALPPTVSINEVTNVEYHTATIAAEVTSDGGASVTERGICYSTTENPTIESNKVVSGKGTGDYTANLTGLQDSTTYYVRAYAVNKKGTAYGEQVSFMTKGYKLPTITTANPTNVEYTSAIVGGNVSSDGGAEVTERGICYSTTENPTVETTKIISGKGTGSYTANLTGLQDSTTYYVRAYAINKKGIAYGEQVSFTTKRCKLPSITTTAPTNISYASVTVGGIVTSDGGAEVTERGVCFSPSGNPTIENSKILIGKGVGEYIVDLTNLSECTTYYIRAYAINKMGINYGQEISVTTLKAPFENGYEYVDLGLSVKWATMNIGSSYPEEYGSYFAFEKWSSELASWGGNWRVPTESNIMELQTNCNWEWTMLNGVYGYKVTSKVYGYKDQSIFLPAAGYFTIDFFDVSTDGYYWSSSRHPYDSSYACHFHFSSNGISRIYTQSLSYKYPIRLVCP
jgi:hypothetical protein